MVEPKPHWIQRRAPDKGVGSGAGVKAGDTGVLTHQEIGVQRRNLYGSRGTKAISAAQVLLKKGGSTGRNIVTQYKATVEGEGHTELAKGLQNLLGANK